MGTKINEKHHFLYLDGLRAVAALYVVVHHSFLQYYPGSITFLTGFKRAVVSATSYGHFAVDLFIVLSGFCLMIPAINNNYCLKGGAFLFFKKRAVRILPPYYFAILVTLVLIWLFIGKPTGTHWDISLPVNYKDVMLHVFLVHDFFVLPSAHISHPLWSISVECRIYLFFPLLLVLWRKMGPVLTGLIAFAACLAMYYGLLLLRTRYATINLLTPGVNPYILLFLLGMFAADLSLAPKNSSILKTGPWRLLTFLFLLLTALCIKLMYGFQIAPDSIANEIKDVVFGFFCCFLLIAINVPVAKNTGVSTLQKLLCWQPLVFTGTFAYSIYLIHAPLLQLLTQYCIMPLKLPVFNAACLLTVLAIITILPIAYLFFLCCEKPFFNWGKKISLAQAEKLAATSPAP